MRADLLALTPEAVAALANLGLVKRALKEIEGGKGPSLSEADDGTVTGTFEDGVTTRLVPGKTLKDNPCSCPAVGVCRHRVAVALAYRGWAQSAAKRAPESTRSSAEAATLSGEADKPSGEANEASGEANEASGEANKASGEANKASGETNKASALDDEPTRVSDEDSADRPARALAADETRDEPARDTRAAEPTAAYGPGVRTAEALAPPPFERWSPGAIQDEAVRTLLGKRAYDDAQTSRKRGIVVEVVRCTPEQPMPTARLPACTVRFLVPRELAYARCDCQVGQGCVHVALAVWAFREADAIDAERLTVAVELHAPEARGAKRRGAADDLRPMLELLEELADTGVVAAREAMAQKFVLAGERLGKAGYVWPATGLEDLAWMLDRYRARSARYHAADALALVTELVARARVASRDPELGAVELPLRYVLGQGEAMETKLDHLRLVSLGARLESDARERTADVLLADPDTGTVMVLSRRWEFGEGEDMPEGPELARRRVAGSSTLGQLAAGQIVTRVARRRANRSLTIGQSSVGSTSVTPQTGDFSALPQPLRVDSIRELAAHLVAQPPAMLRPRVLAESVHAVRVAAVGSVGFDAGAQRLVGEVFDRDGARLFLASPFRGAAPHALDVLGRALAGGMGAVRWVAGSVSHDGHGFSIDPTLVVGDRVVAPDVEDRGDHGSLASVAAERPLPSRSAMRLEATRSVLEEAFHLGLSSVPSSHEARVDRAARELEEIGARGLATRMERYREARVRRRAGEPVSVAAAFFDAAIRVALALEAARSVSLGALAEGAPGAVLEGDAGEDDASEEDAGEGDASEDDATACALVSALVSA